MLRRLLLSLTLGAVLLVPSSSFAAAQTSHVSGVITNVPGGINVALTNNGQTILQYLWVRMFMVRHTGCSADQGGGCAPGGDPNTVRGYWANFGPGQTRNLTITTDSAYPANGGADIFESQFFNSPLMPAGKATGPAAAAPPCKCVSLTAAIPPRSLKIREFRGDEVESYDIVFSFTIRATMRCSSGVGRCKGSATLVAPKGRTYKMSFSDDSPTGVQCNGPCGKTTTATQKVELEGYDLAPTDRAKVGRIPLVIKRVCKGQTKKTPLSLSIAFTRNGSIDLKKSKLG